jgi:hypothetical protein
MRPEIRLILTQYRFGLVGFSLILVVIAAALWGLAALFASSGLRECGGVTAGSACVDLANRLAPYTLLAGMLQGVATPAVMFAGVYVGTPIIASEIERGTAVLPWTMGASRLRWLAPRVVLIAVWLFVFSTAIGLGIDRIHEIAISPNIPITENLDKYEFRGWIVPARALVAFAAALLAGAVLGRALPALLAGVALSGVVVAGVLVFGSILNGMGMERVGYNDGSIVNTLVLVDKTTGGYISYGDAEAIIPQGDPAFEERFDEVPLGVPGRASLLVVTREVLALLVGAAALLAAGVFVTDRRKPY